MTTHLSPEQFIEAAEGTLAHAASSHLEACEACRREVSELVALMGDLQTASDRTEPSPLFWDHFSQRVQAATAAEPVPAHSWWHAWRPIATVAAVAAMVLLMVELRMPRATSAPGTSGVSGVTPADSNLAAVPAGDDAMNFVTELAADLSWDDLQQVAQPSRDVTIAAVDQLTASQRAELARLVKAAMDGAE
jgi:hypothetical protein